MPQNLPRPPSFQKINPAEYDGIGEHYAKINLPTMIIWGESDYIVKPKIGQRLHQDIPGSRLKLVERCGHNPHEERPAETFAALESFCVWPREESQGGGE